MCFLTHKRTEDGDCSEVAGIGSLLKGVYPVLKCMHTYGLDAFCNSVSAVENYLQLHSSLTLSVCVSSSSGVVVVLNVSGGEGPKEELRGVITVWNLYMCPSV